MRIRINGADADIRIETEKTVGEILSALEAWLEGTGHRLSGLGIDGEAMTADSIGVCIGRDIDGIDELDIYTSSVSELFAECLIHVMESLDAYERADFEGKGSIAAFWMDSPSAKMLAEQNPGLFDWVTKTFSGEGSGPRALRPVIEERLRELKEPMKEMDGVSAIVADICARLEEFPLDIQTGKDARAAETISVFSGVAEKVFRIYGILSGSGFPVGEIKVGDSPITDYMTEFHASLMELLGAYERSDTVLVGDIAEYEMAPRLRCLHAAVLGALKGTRQ